MKAPLLIVALILGLSVAVVACEDGDEELAPAVTGTPAGQSSSTPLVDTPTPTLVTVTPVPVPSDWQEYTDAVLGFSFRYPPDLEFTVVTTPIPGDSWDERVLVAKSSSDLDRFISISIIGSKARGQSLAEWTAVYSSCRPDSMGETFFGGGSALACMRTGPLGPPHPAVITEHLGKVFLITFGLNLVDAERASLQSSFQF